MSIALKVRLLDLVQVFSRFDKNKDGVLDVQDLKVITKQAGIKLTEQELHEMLKAAGKNSKLYYRFDVF